MAVTAGIDISMNAKRFRRINRKYYDGVELALPRAARRALKRGKEKSRTEIKKAVMNIHLRSSSWFRVKDLYKEIDKRTKGRIKENDINKMFYSLTMRGGIKDAPGDKGFSLIRFSNNKTPTVMAKRSAHRKKQIAGKKYIKRKRRPTKVTIVKNRTVVLKTSFIAKADGKFKFLSKGHKYFGANNRQVFQRRSKPGKKGGWLMRRGTQSLHSLNQSHQYLERKVKTPVAIQMSKTFLHQFARESKRLSAS